MPRKPAKKAIIIKSSILAFETTGLERLEPTGRKGRGKEDWDNDNLEPLTR